MLVNAVLDEIQTLSEPISASTGKAMLVSVAWLSMLRSPAISVSDGKVMLVIPRLTRAKLESSVARFDSGRVARSGALRTRTR